ncbi:MAG: MarR family transcriptional regulator [Eubacteriales bacterium]|nr:MarR family transcriptional regulator [Eubacteriales bacterium]
MKNNTIMSHVSMMYRQVHRFYDKKLAEYNIGSGQLSFLVCIHEHEGISMYELARLGHFDKATVTKGIRKLEEQEYIRVETDKADKRLRRLYTTEKALLIIEQLYDIRQEWNEILVDGLTPEEAAEAERLLEIMAQNAWRYMNERS